MKSILSTKCNEKQELPYPKLMWKPHTLPVWGMYEAGIGVCLKSGGVYYKGEHIKVLEMGFLEDYIGNEEP